MIRYLVIAVLLAGCTAPSIDTASALDYLADGAATPKNAQAAYWAGANLDLWPPGQPIGPVVDAMAPGWPNSLWMLDAGRGTPTHRAAILESWNETFGSPSNLADDAWALVVLGPSNDTRLAQTAANLLAVQSSDGGWSWDGGPGSIDETAWVIAGLRAMDDFDTARTSATAFVRAAQAPDGSYGIPGLGSNCQSTAMGVWASSMLELRVAQSLQYLAACQNSDGGFGYQPGDDSQPWSTMDVLVGLGHAGLLS